MSRRFIKGKDGKFQGSVPDGSQVPSALASMKLPSKPSLQQKTIWVCALCGTDYDRHPGACYETAECMEDQGGSVEERYTGDNKPVNQSSGNIPHIKQLVRIPSNRPCENCTAERAVRGYDLCDDCDDALDFDYAENGFSSVSAYAASLGVRAQPRPKNN